jgi:hypothetical protein
MNNLPSWMNPDQIETLSLKLLGMGLWVVGALFILPHLDPDDDEMNDILIRTQKLSFSIA